jgi:hypothetical protein
VVILGLFNNIIEKLSVITDPQKNKYNLQIHRQNDIKPQCNRIGLKDIHPDIKDLIWIADGIKKNYYPEQERDINTSNSFFTIFIECGKEPSAIYTRLPISTPNGINNIERPPYYPSYSILTQEQRWVYINYLSNPYSDCDIGYVFLLYYGLERHMIYGNFERAFDVVLKLRAVHKNKSFQQYSSIAVATMCVFHNRADLLNKFINSVNGDYANSIDFDIFIILCLFLNVGLSAEQLVQYCRVFGFTNNRYIKSDHALFIHYVEEFLQQKYNSSYLPISYLLNSDIKKFKRCIFANMSLTNKNTEIPHFVSCLQFIQSGFSVLQTAHENVKKYKAIQRKKQ